MAERRQPGVHAVLKSSLQNHAEIARPAKSAPLLKRFLYPKQLDSRTIRGRGCADFLPGMLERRSEYLGGSFSAIVTESESPGASGNASLFVVITVPIISVILRRARNSTIGVETRAR